MSKSINDLALGITLLNKKGTSDILATIIMIFYTSEETTSELTGNVHKALSEKQ